MLSWLKILTGTEHKNTKESRNFLRKFTDKTCETLKKRKMNREVSHAKYINMLKQKPLIISAESCRRLLNTKRNCKQQVGGEVERSKSACQKAQTSTKKKVQNLCHTKNQKYSSLYCERKQPCKSLWEAEPFFNSFLPKPWIDIWSDVLNIYQTKASFKISISFVIAKRNISSPEFCEAINLSNRESKKS